MPTGQATPRLPTLRRIVLARQSAARSDGDLLGAFVAERDADAFAELVRRHGPMVLGVCRRVIGHRATADDAFQAAFLVLARRAASVRPREQVGNFLYGVAYRTALKARMVLARQRSREKQVDVMPEPTAPAAHPAWTDLQPVIDEELARLPDKLRLPVVLCDLEGRPQREVAKHLDVPPATLATRLASARRTLAARLTRRGVTLSGGALAGLLGTHASASAVPTALATGVVRAGEAVATGAAFNTLVSASAVQLSEGVMRMMMLAKLKAVAVMTVAALVLSTGLGVGLVPAAADDSAPRPGAPAIAAPARAAPAPAGQPKAAEPTDDATFLRRLSMDVRGTVPTDVEMWFFVSDADDDKRAKVVEWITDDDAAKVAIAKKLGVPPDRVKVVRARLSADGKFVEVKLEDTFIAGPAVAFAPDGGKVVIGGTLLQDYTAVVTRARAQHAVDRLIVKAAENAPEKGAIAVWEKILTTDDKPGKAAGAAHGEFIKVWGHAAPDAKPEQTYDVFVTEFLASVGTPADSDAEFLKRVLTDVRGTGPTALELKYFTEDKDPKKREKLLDTLLKDAATQKKLGDAWKAKMLALKPTTFNITAVSGGQIILQDVPKAKQKDVLLPIVVRPIPPTPPAPPQPPVVKPFTAPVVVVPQADRLEKLVSELIAAKKSDEALLEAITLATLSRLPTDSEKKLTLAVLGKTADRRAAWLAVARALAGTDDKPTPVKVKVLFEPVPPTPPVPPAKP